MNSYCLKNTSSIAKAEFYSYSLLLISLHSYSTFGIVTGEFHFFFAVKSSMTLLVLRTRCYTPNCLLFFCPLLYGCFGWNSWSPRLIPILALWLLVDSTTYIKHFLVGHQNILFIKFFHIFQFSNYLCLTNPLNSSLKYRSFWDLPHNIF